MEDIAFLNTAKYFGKQESSVKIEKAAIHLSDNCFYSNY